MEAPSQDVQSDNTLLGLASETHAHIAHATVDLQSRFG
jgi:hypothetical protein